MSWRTLLNEAALKNAIETVALRDTGVQSALSRVGFPAPRIAEPGFESLVRILIGQQLSVKAAASIHGRFMACFPSGLSPSVLLKQDDTTLRAAGLSAGKTRYVKALAKAIEDRDIDLEQIATMSADEAMNTLTQVVGIGPWTAQIYLLFCEGRPDIWPAGDLALQEALRRLKVLSARPTAKETLPLVAPWQPWRGAMAVFLWHYYAASDAPI